MSNADQRLAKQDERIRGLYLLLHPELEHANVPVDCVLDQVETLLQSYLWEHDESYPSSIQAFVRWSPDALISLRDHLRAEFPLTHIEVHRTVHGEDEDLIGGVPAEKSAFYEHLRRVRKLALEFHPDD